MRIPVQATAVFVGQFMATLPASVSFIDEARLRGEKVLIHCKKGHTRSATVVLNYLVFKEKMTVLQAKKAIQDKRPAALCRPYERNCLLHSLLQ